MPRKQTSPSKFRVECFLLCDYARVENGKFYMLGAGWDLLSPPRLPSAQMFFVAVKLVVPSSEAIKDHTLMLSFVDGEGADVAEVNVELMPPSREDPGVDEVSILLPLIGQVTINKPGPYRALLSLGRTKLAETRFRVVPLDESEGDQETV